MSMPPPINPINTNAVSASHSVSDGSGGAAGGGSFQRPQQEESAFEKTDDYPLDEFVKDIEIEEKGIWENIKDFFADLFRPILNLFGIRNKD
jgi:hypothetical protein